MSRGRSRQVVQRLADDLGAGKSLSQAMQRQGSFFDALSVSLVRHGEQTDMLPLALRDAATIAKNQQDLMTRLRESLAYPVVCLLLCVIIFLAILRYIMPLFADMFAELGGEDFLHALPPLTVLVLDLSDLVNRAWMLVVILISLAVITCGSFLLGSGPVDRFARLLIYRLPYASRMLHHADHARLARLLSRFIARGLPVDEALWTASLFVERRALAAHLRSCADAVHAGKPAGHVLASSRSCDRSLPLIFAHAPEAELAAGLDDLADLYLERLDSVRAKLVAATTVGAHLFLAIVIGMTIIAMFLPLIKVIDMLGGM